MARIHGTEKLGNDTLAIVETASSGGGRNMHPVMLRLVVLEGDTAFTRINAKNVKFVAESRYLDGRCNGPKSKLGRAVVEMQEAFATAHRKMEIAARMADSV